MKTNIKLFSLMLLAVLVFVPLHSAAAQGLMEGRVIFGQSFTLKSGESLDGDLVLFGGSATIEEGATVNGNAVLFGGNLVIDGEVTGDAAIVGGSMTLGAKAHIHGDLSTVGASLDRKDGSQIDGQIFNTATGSVSDGNNGSSPVPPTAIPPSIVVPEIHFDPFQSVWSVANAFGEALAIAVLAMLLMLFLAPHADRVAHAVLVQPLTAGGLGLLTIVAGVVALIALGILSILVVTLIITVPLIIIVPIAVGMAALFGWIAVGYEIGQRFVKVIHQEWHPAFTAALGTFALTLVSRALTDIPVLNLVGWLAPFLVGLAALGAVVMTRFGTQTVNAPVKAPAVIPPAASSGENPVQ